MTLQPNRAQAQTTGPYGPPIAASVAVPQSLAAERFTTPINDCQVKKRDYLNTYRQLWRKWMSWYEHTPGEPNSIESQIHQMIFNDLTYRASVSVRESVVGGTGISAHSPTLAYLIDRGYVLSQVLAIQKLLDKGSDVISIRRLLKDVEKHRDVITREVYVSGDGHPYDYDPFPGIYGFGDVRLFFSKLRHETFDKLSGKQASQRSREDTIRPSVFKTLNGWIDVPSADQIERIRNNFIAHSADPQARSAPVRRCEILADRRASASNNPSRARLDRLHPRDRNWP